jgi:hypothetical protein
VVLATLMLIEAVKGSPVTVMPRELLSWIRKVAVPMYLTGLYRKAPLEIHC